MIQIAHTWGKITLSVWKDFAPPHSSCRNNDNSVLSLVYWNEALPFLWNSWIKEIKYLVKYHKPVASSPLLPLPPSSSPSYVHNVFRILKQLCFFSRTPLEGCMCLCSTAVTNWLIYAKLCVIIRDIHILVIFSFINTIPVSRSFRLVRWQQHSSQSVLYRDIFHSMLLLLNYYYKKMR